MKIRDKANGFREASCPGDVLVSVQPFDLLGIRFVVIRDFLHLKTFSKLRKEIHDSVNCALLLLLGKRPGRSEFHFDIRVSPFRCARSGTLAAPVQIIVYAAGFTVFLRNLPPEPAASFSRNRNKANIVRSGIGFQRPGIRLQLDAVHAGWEQTVRGNALPVRY